MSKHIEVSDETAALLAAYSAAAGISEADLVARWVQADPQAVRSAKIAHMQHMVDEGRASGSGSRSMSEVLKAARQRAGVAL